MKTRERILQTSLQLFNQHGEPNITTNHIAIEMDISPGNLYYHFHNKDEIIYDLFLAFEQQMIKILETPQSRDVTMEDIWLYLHLIFENIWEYRFFYRDLDNLLSRSKKLHSHFKNIMNRKIQTAVTICEGLVESGVMEASASEIEALAHNIALIATYWLNFKHIYNKRQETVENHLGEGVYHVISLVAPFLKGNARKLLYKLSHVYLE